MMYLIGTEEQRRDFEDQHRIPYFTYEEQTDPDVVALSDPEEGHGILIVNLSDEDPLYTVQVMGEDGGIESETDYPDYESALAAYEELDA